MNEQHQLALRALYRRTRNEAPSQITDKRIRKAAQHAVLRRRPGWLLPLSTAAMLVLSFSIVLQVARPPASLEEKLALPPRSAVSPKPESSSGPPASAPAWPQQKEMESFKLAPQDELPGEDAAAESSSYHAEEMRDSALQQRKKRELTAAPGLSAGSVAVQRGVRVPLLPRDIAALTRIHGDLRAHALPAEGVALYQGEEKILEVISGVKGERRFRAWPGANILDVEVDWDTTPPGLSHCTREAAWLVCALTARIQGAFIDARLDHIRWTQFDE